MHGWINDEEKQKDYSGENAISTFYCIQSSLSSINFYSLCFSCQMHIHRHTITLPPHIWSMCNRDSSLSKDASKCDFSNDVNDISNSVELFVSIGKDWSTSENVEAVLWLHGFTEFNVEQFDPILYSCFFKVRRTISSVFTMLSCINKPYMYIAYRFDYGALFYTYIPVWRKQIH